MQVSAKIDFANLNNTRDLGGMLAADGRRIAPGRLIRSGHLFFASERDADRLSALVDEVVDFRTDGERAEKPDPELAFVTFHHIPIFGKTTAGVTREESVDWHSLEGLLGDADGARDYMCRAYGNFVDGELARAGYRRFLELLAAPREGALLWHCTAGKDRAGFASVIVQEILGVPRDAIMADYLYTNECLAEEVASLRVMLRGWVTGGVEEVSDEAVGYLFGAHREFLEAAYARAEESYGSFERYLADGLGVTPEMVDDLRALSPLAPQERISLPVARLRDTIRAEGTSALEKPWQHAHRNRTAPTPRRSTTSLTGARTTPSCPSRRSSSASTASWWRLTANWS